MSTLQTPPPVAAPRAGPTVVRATGVASLLAVAWLAAACQSAGPDTPAQVEPALAARAAASAPASGARAAASGPKTSSQPPAQRPLVSTSHGYTVRWLRPLAERGEHDGVDVIDDGWRAGLRLVVTSSAGIGSAEVQPTGAVWPRTVQLQFQYADGRPFDGLEGLRVQVINPAHQAGDEVPPLPPDGFVVWQREGTLRVVLPEGWLSYRQGLRVQWVDRYR